MRRCCRVSQCSFSIQDPKKTVSVAPESALCVWVGLGTHVLDALGPHVLVQLHVDAHVRSLHRLLRELLDLQRAETGREVSAVCEGAYSIEWHAASGNAARRMDDALTTPVPYWRASASLDACGSRRRMRNVPPPSPRPVAAYHGVAARAPSPSKNLVFRSTHRVNRAGRPLLEGDSVERLADVDGVFAGHDILGLPHDA
jgi:hypothetical protein